MATPGKTKETAIDLSSLDTVAACNKPYELELVHPVTKVGLKQYISILGKDSDAMREYNEDKFDTEARQAALNTKRGLDAPVPTLAQRRADGTKMLVALTVGFRDLNYAGQSPYPFSIQNAIRLYTEQNWIRTQVDNAVVAIENFMPG